MTPLFALAFDHRSSLRRDFLGLTSPLAAEHVALCRRLKIVVFDGLVQAVEGDGVDGEPAILVDEEYGADVITRARARGLTVVVPVEVSGQAELAFEHGDDGFGPAIERVDPTYVKALVRYDPAGDVELNRRQVARLARLQGWLEDHGRDWMVEVLSVRPAGAVEQLVAAGLRPRFWKLEGQATSADYEALAAITRGADRDDTACLVLGRGADAAAVDRWLSLAAPVPGYAGFAVGRTLWWDPLRALVRGQLTDHEAAAAVAANYRRLVHVYLGALTRVT